MDSRLVNAKAEEYSGRSVRLTPALIEQLGLEKRSSHLKIDEFYLSCVPFDLSLRKASLLSFLSESEVAFFSKLSGKAQKLSLTFMLPYAKKPATFFVLCDLKAFRKPAPPSPYCFIDVEFREAPLVLKEILVGYFAEADEAAKFYETAGDETLSLEQAAALFGGPRLALLKEGCEAGSLKVCSLSPRRLRVFGELEGLLPAAGEVVELEPCEGDSSCLVRGALVEHTPFAEAPGFAFLGIALEYSPRLHAKMRRLLAQGAGSAAGAGRAAGAATPAGAAGAAGAANGGAAGAGSPAKA